MDQQHHLGLVSRVEYQKRQLFFFSLYSLDSSVLTIDSHDLLLLETSPFLSKMAFRWFCPNRHKKPHINLSLSFVKLCIFYCFAYKANCKQKSRMYNYISRLNNPCNTALRKKTLSPVCVRDGFHVIDSHTAGNSFLLISF